MEAAAPAVNPSLKPEQEDATALITRYAEECRKQETAINVSELIRRTGLTRPTVNRILSTLNAPKGKNGS